MNAADRMWRALSTGDWKSLRAQLSPQAVIEHPGERELPASEYVAQLRVAGTPEAVDIRRSTGDGTIVALEASVLRGGQRWRVVALYDLHDAHIARGTEVWVRET